MTHFFRSLVCTVVILGSAGQATAQVQQFGLTFIQLGNAVLNAINDPEGSRLVVSNIGLSGADGFKVSRDAAAGMEFTVVVDPDPMPIGAYVRFGFLRPDGTFAMSITDLKINPNTLQVTTQFSDINPPFRTVEAYLNGVLVGRVDHNGAWDAMINTTGFAGRHMDVVTGQDGTRVGIWVPMSGAAVQVTLPNGATLMSNQLRFIGVNNAVPLPPPADVAWTFSGIQEFVVVGARYAQPPASIPLSSPWTLTILGISLVGVGAVVMRRV